MTNRGFLVPEMEERVILLSPLRLEKGIKIWRIASTLSYPLSDYSKKEKRWRIAPTLSYPPSDYRREEKDEESPLLSLSHT